MTGSAVARKYAQALFGAAGERGEVDRVAEDVTSLRALLAADPRLLRFLGSPDVTQERKEAFLADVLGERVTRLTREFLELLLTKGRIAILPAALARFEELLEAARGLVRVQAVTAVPLGPEARGRLVERLQHVTGRTVLLSESVDPGVLGGVVVQVGGKIIDGSVRSALQGLKARLLGAPLHP